ncbi:MAG: cation:proton antiporter, partial [Candidatus Zixiibacteriota bacterium]
SSTAIVLKSLQDRAEIDSAHGRMILSILIFQDVIIAPMVIFTPFLTGGGGSITYSVIALGIKAVAIVVIVIILARFVVPIILNQIVQTRSRELFLLCTVLICIAVAWLTNNLGLSLGLGAFLAGLVISQSEYSYQALEGVLPFRVIFTSFFFVSIGMLLDVSLFATQPVVILGAALVLILVKFLVAGLVALILGMSSRTAVIVGLGLCQVGEFSFILMREGMEFNLLDQNTYQIFLALSILTMGVTPFAINLSPKVADKMSRWPVLRRFRAGSYTTLTGLREEAKALNDHLVIIGFGVNGRNIGRAAKFANIQYIVIEANPDSVRTYRARGEPMMYGDATSRSVLRYANVAKARVVVVAISDPIATRRVTHAVHNANPAAFLIVRTRFVAETQALLELGASEIIPEEFETSVEIFTRVMMKYLVTQDEIEKFTNEIRSNSYSMLRRPSGKGPTMEDLRLHTPEIEIKSIKVTDKSPLAGITLAETQLRNRYGVSVVAIMRDSKLITNPSSAEKLHRGDVLYVLGTTEHCAKATREIA